MWQDVLGEVLEAFSKLGDTIINCELGFGDLIGPVVWMGCRTVYLSMNGGGKTYEMHGRYCTFHCSYLINFDFQ